MKPEPMDLWTIIERRGFPLALAVILLAVFLGWIPNPLLDIKAALVRQAAALEAHARTTTEAERLLRLLCLYQARNPSEARACAPPRESVP